MRIHNRIGTSQSQSLKGWLLLALSSLHRFRLQSRVVKKRRADELAGGQVPREANRYIRRYGIIRSSSFLGVSQDMKIISEMRQYLGLVPRVFGQCYRFLRRKRVKRYSRQLGNALMALYFLTAAGFVILIIFNFGLQAKIIDFPLFVTLWVAEVPIAVFLRYILNESRRDRPQLIFADECTYTKDNANHHGIKVTNEGDVGAQSCEARLALKISQDNVDDLQGAIITKQNFHRIRDEMLCWKTGDGDTDGEVSIKAGHHGFLEILRMLGRTDDLPLAIEIPSAKGWAPPLVRLKPRSYEGSVRILSMNSRPVSLEFDILYDEKDRAVKIDF